MQGKLTALIQGSGFASQGHTEAFRHCGVEVVGMVSRTPNVVADVARQMNIGYASTDWNKALLDLKPDIVAIGTPGGAHFQPILAAIEQGCHIYCDKPLTTNAADARTLYIKSREKGLKTAYAASFRYQPYALLAKELVAMGEIGEPLEVECVSHYNLNPLIPFGWSHRIDLGGGRLSNNFTHKLAIVLNVLDGTILRVNGETRNDMYKAPVVEGVHDFRERERFAPTPEEAKANPDRWEWRDVDSEWGYTVMAKLGTDYAKRETVSALFKHGGLHPRFQSDYVAFYGSEGAIFIEGAYVQGPLHLYDPSGKKWKQTPLPDRIVESLPPMEEASLRNWTALAQDFVHDIQGKGYNGYQTFRDGWIYQEVVDAVRASNGWFDVPQDA